MEGLPDYIDEEEEEEEEEFWPITIRAELIEYVLRRYGSLKARDLARILGCKLTDVRQVLRQLERSGRVKKAKLGRNYIWESAEERHSGFMYY
jgi:predicted ArsR family transcriptional regulator